MQAPDHSFFCEHLPTRMIAAMRSYVLTCSLLLASGLIGCGENAPPGLADGPLVQPLPDLGSSEGLAGDLGAPDGTPDILSKDGLSKGDRGLDIQTSDGPKPPPLRDDGKPAGDWFGQASQIASRNDLSAAFKTAGYTPPSSTYLIAARVVPGLNQPALQIYSLAATGFTYSQGHFWPASTIKLAAAVGALWTLEGYGLTGDATVSFSDDDGTYSGTVAKLYDLALRVSDNVAYNRLVEIAGFDPLNDQLLVQSRGLPQMVIQRRYTKPLPSSNLRTSPAITFSEGAKSGTIPQRIGTGNHASCPKEGNCTTLFELLDVMRRVTLHGELPSGERFPLAAKDQQRLLTALQGATTEMQPGAGQALGHPLTIYNKPGQVYNNERLDHGLIVDNTTGERFLIAYSLPYNSTSAAVASTLTKQALAALKLLPADGATLQLDAGVKIVVQSDDKGPGSVPGTRAYRLTASAPGADELEIWVDGWRIGTLSSPAPHFVLDYAFNQSGDRLVVVQARAKGKLIGYRALRLTVK
jgi:hypothetical protein